MFAIGHILMTLAAAVTSVTCWPFLYSTVRSDRGNIEKQSQGTLERAFSR